MNTPFVQALKEKYGDSFESQISAEAQKRSTRSVYQDLDFMSTSGAISSHSIPLAIHE